MLGYDCTPSTKSGDSEASCVPDEHGRVNFCKVSAELRDEFREERGDRQWEPFLREVLKVYREHDTNGTELDAIREIMREENQRLREGLLSDLRGSR